MERFEFILWQNRYDFFVNNEIFCKDTNEKCIGYAEYLNSEHWKNIRNLLLENTKTCSKCKKEFSKSYLRIHHKSYKNLGNENINEDLQVLCNSCHKKLHARKNKKRKTKTKRKKKTI